MRLCACPCKRSLEGMRKDAVWYSRACAVRWARENPGKSLFEARSANKGRTRKPSGLQLSYRKAVEHVADSLEVVIGPRATAVRVAEHTLSKALSPRQRARLEQQRRKETL